MEMQRTKATETELAVAVIRTPIGPLRLVASDRGIRRVEFRPRVAGAAASPGSPAAARHLRQAARELEEYFAGRRKSFAVALDLPPSDRQSAWLALGEIPYGRTTTYGELARRLGSPGAARAIGRACATNPLPVLLPCHRVVGADGSLTGFGGGLETKRRLLEHEGALLKLQ
jgi:methylated-DNA-[protein]-cysteine S-methyltransferase